MSANDKLQVKYLGRQPYQTIWQAMKDFTDQRDENTGDECWLLEHEPVFTLGQAGKPEHLLQHSDIPLVQSDRGGQITYHGPGQLMVYWLVDLKRRQLQVREFVSLLERVVIETLASYGINAHLQQGAPGVYVQGAKIASLGLRVRRGCTYHGLSLNVAMDLAPFQQINPCGYAGLAMTQMNDLLDPPATFAQVRERLLATFIRELGYKAVQTDMAGVC